MSYFQKEKQYLECIVAAPSQQQKKALIRCASRDQLKALGEVALNILNLVVPLNDGQRDTFKKKKELLIRLAGKKIKSAEAGRHWKIISSMIEVTCENYEEI